MANHSDRIWALSWHPKLPILVSASADHTIKIWRFTEEHNLDLLATLEGHRRSVRRVAFSPCGTLLASCSFDGSTILWKVPSDNNILLPSSSSLWLQITKLEGHENEVKDIAWSAYLAEKELYYLATCGRDKSLWIWEISMADQDYDADCIAVLQEHTQDVKCLAWHPTSITLISASADDTIKVWHEDSLDSGDWSCCHTIEAAHMSTIWRVAFNPSASFFISCSEDGHLKGWHYGSFSCLFSIRLSERPLYSLDLHQNIIVVAAGDDSIYFIQLPSLSKFLSLTDTDTSNNLVNYTVQRHVEPRAGDFLAVAFCPFAPIAVASGDCKIIHLIKSPI